MSTKDKALFLDELFFGQITNTFFVASASQYWKEKDDTDEEGILVAETEDGTGDQMYSYPFLSYP